MIDLFGVVEHTAIDERANQFGAFSNIPFLKRIREEHLNMATQWENEGNNLIQWCVRAFLLYLICFTIFIDNINKHIDIISLDKGVTLTQ